MRFIMLKDAKPGMILARGVYNDNGIALLSQNTNLTEHYIYKLNELDIIGIYISEKTVRELVNV